MVPYFGKHSAKMYLRGKPIHFGYILWSLCRNDGFPNQLNIYTDKDFSRVLEEPLGQQVILKLLNVVLKNSMPRYHEVYFDNFFTSSKLLDIFSSIGFASFDTVWDNGTDGASSLIMSSKNTKKKSRGTYEYRCNGNLYVCKWNDNSVVNITSNFLTHEPVFKAKQ